MTTQKIINNFTIKIATTNGTGSQSANNILFKSLVRMGTATSAKNLFPSNIQGLPTWFHIRTNPKGYQAMKRFSEILVAMNPTSSGQDLGEVKEGCVVIYDSTVISIGQEKPGVTYYAAPMSRLAKDNFDTPRLRTLLTNALYLGVISYLFGVDKKIITQVVQDTFKKKQKVVDVNLKAIELGYEYAKGNFTKKDPYFYAPDNKFQNKIIIEGNQASALGCIFGGCTVAAWYPITPASSFSETLDAYAKRFRVDPATQKKKMAILQAEDEIAAVGMAIGAGWAGARSVTGTSGPGISLMNEFIGLAYYAEIPIVICNVQRVGPSTGLPTRTQQADIIKCIFASHGDAKHIVLMPGTVEESYELTASAFDIAERIQTPVLVLTDLELGMNLWASDPFKYCDKPFDRGKVLTEKDLEKIKEWGRYADADKDGIPYRTLPGNPHPLAPYFTRGTGHTQEAGYSEDPAVYQANMHRLGKKYKTAVKYLPKPLISGDKKSKFGIISVGTTHHAVVEALDTLKDKNHIPVKYLRVLAYPFHEDIKTFVQECDKVLVVEQNRDAQLMSLLKMDLDGSSAKLSSLAYSDGLPIDPDVITHKAREVFVS
ncbi:MAG: 2-oxoacid:acceptor oxidoreductase subunit alpha [Deltaproteobacteria bacterium]|nr:2-oxoacid:acceptor oxidoreductase subunit alpha [Deltaproteobacteria bacterium]